MSMTVPRHKNWQDGRLVFFQSLVEQFLSINFASYAQFSENFDDSSSLPTDHKTIDLSAYDGQQIYIAFVMMQIVKI